MLTSSTARSRLSGGFTLDEAARIYRATAQGRPGACPSCGGVIHDVVGSHPSGQVSLVQCSTCGRSLVFEHPGTRALR
jgi:hypothetical protein